MSIWNRQSISVKNAKGTMVDTLLQKELIQKKSIQKEIIICEKCGGAFNNKVNHTQNEKIYKSLCIPCRLKMKNILYEKKLKLTGKYTLTRWISNILAQHRKKFNVNIDTLELTEKWKNITHCYICGIKLDWSYNKKKIQGNSPSIDRINNENFMNINNVQLICTRCNRIKSDNTMDNFIKSCKKIVDYNKNIKYNIPGVQVRFA